MIKDVLHAIIYPYPYFKFCTVDVWELLFHPTLYNGCNYLSMLELKLNHVIKKRPSFLHCTITYMLDKKDSPYSQSKFRASKNLIGN